MDSACKDKDLKIFVSYDEDKIEEAKQICKTCTVQRECLSFFHESSVVTAGTSRYDRLELLWKRAKNERDNNWNTPDKTFPKLFEGK